MLSDDNLSSLGRAGRGSADSTLESGFHLPAVYAQRLHATRDMEPSPIAIWSGLPGSK